MHDDPQKTGENVALNANCLGRRVCSFDFKMRKPEQVRQSVMEKLKKRGKGIVLVHDFQRATAEAAMDLFRGADLRVRRAFASDQAGHAQNPAFNLRNSTLPRR